MFLKNLINTAKSFRIIGNMVKEADIGFRKLHEQIPVRRYLIEYELAGERVTVLDPRYHLLQKMLGAGSQFFSCFCLFNIDKNY